MLINAPPARRGKAFRRDGYCGFESDGVFSKNELGRSIIKACWFRHELETGRILPCFWAVYYF